MLFAEQGFSGLRIEEVARSAGAARSQVYRLFPDKQALLAALVREDVEAFVSRIAGAVQQDASLEGMLQAGAEAFLSFVDERRTEYQLLFGLTGRIDPDVAAVIRGLHSRLADEFLRQFRPAVEAAGVPWPGEAEARIITRAAMALAEGAAQAWLVEPDLPRARVAQIVAGMIADALAPGAGNVQGVPQKRL